MAASDLDRMADDGCPHCEDETLGEGAWDGADCQGPTPRGLLADPEIRQLIADSERFWANLRSEGLSSPLFTDEEIDGPFSEDGLPSALVGLTGDSRCPDDGDDCGDNDMNDTGLNDDGRWDDDPNMYGRTYNEE